MTSPLPTWKAPLVWQPGHPEWSRRPWRAEQGRADPVGGSARAGWEACPSLASSSQCTVQAPGCSRSPSQKAGFAQTSRQVVRAGAHRGTLQSESCGKGRVRFSVQFGFGEGAALHTAAEAEEREVEEINCFWRCCTLDIPFPSESLFSKAPALNQVPSVTS